MNKRTRYIATAFIAIICLSLVSIPIVATEFMHIEIEPQGEVEGSVIFFIGAPPYQLGGYISSNVPVMVEIYDEPLFGSKLIYCDENCSHQIDEQIEHESVKIVVTNNQPHTANVSYCLKADSATVRLSHVKKS